MLALVLDSAIDVTGAEHGFIMLANEHGRLDFKLGRAQGRITLAPYIDDSKSYKAHYRARLSSAIPPSTSLTF